MYEELRMLNEIYKTAYRNKVYNSNTSRKYDAS